MFLTKFESWVYKGVIYLKNMSFRQNGNDIDPPLSMRVCIQNNTWTENE